MRLTKYFWITQTLLLTLQIVPWIFTKDAPTYDGSAMVGFPLPFYLYGGECPLGACPSTVIWWAFIIDAAVFLGMSLLVNLFFIRKKEKVSKSALQSLDSRF